jgi:CRP-like cAMP-binding protein
VSAPVDVGAFVRALGPFRDLGPADQTALAAALLVHEHDAGHVFVREGERADSVFLVISGEIEVGRDHGGSWEGLNRLSAGELFGLVALVDAGPRSATCRAATPAVVGSMPRNVFSLLFNAHAPISLAFQQALCAQLARDFRGLDRQLQQALAAVRTPTAAPS